MRKDLKIGMAIGAVLLVVVIVYFAVPNAPTDVAQDTGTTDEQVTDTGTEQPPAEAPATTDPQGPAVAEAPAETQTPDAPAETLTASAERKDPFESDSGMWGRILNGEQPAQTITPSLSNVSRVAPETPAAPAADETATATAEPTAPTAADETVTAEPTPESETAVQPEIEKPVETVKTEVKTTGARTHTVKAGEDFSKIARDAYGNARHYLAIMEANPTLDPTKLRPGTVINLPDIAAAKSETAARTTGTSENVATKRDRQIDPAKEYRVQSGDSLYKIAMKQYGSSGMVEALYEANKATIGNDSSRLKLGMVLKLPPNPNSQSASR